ncbi:uncharacterized protein LOC135499236 [Lineus longissimus]|uniref:uncharacterized protein LOC135499236 n=1 Tax=Lineus longissimus TaxID=88925 RepID=UPI00315D9478
MSTDDRKAMKMFEETCEKVGDRYVIGLPWKRDPLELPDNRPLAEKRLMSLERSLLKQPEKAALYTKTVNEYLEKGWAVPVKPNELEIKPAFYLPHHGVYRPEKVSTPLRVVFDPACNYDGVSLNSFLHNGPNLIGDLLGVLIRFREDLVAIVGDISKMFLQVLLKEEETHVHRFMWRDLDVTRKPDVYRLTRVTFGDKPSPDMASFVILKIAQEYQNTYPDTAENLKKDRYMDDMIHSCPSDNTAVQRMSSLDKMLGSGGFRMKEWYCSAITRKPEMGESHGTKPGININLSQDSIKTLGVGWNPSTDSILFQVKDLGLDGFTKRLVLSRLSMLFDPLGLATPVTIRAKCAMQAIWRLENVGWDDTLPTEHTEMWREIFQELNELETIRLPRCVKPVDAIEGTAELHTFADTSIKAYGAVAYMVWSTPQGPSVRLMAAKARVALLRQTTIPCLELMAAPLAARLARTIHSELRIKPSVHF